MKIDLRIKTIFYRSYFEINRRSKKDPKLNAHRAFPLFKDISDRSIYSSEIVTDDGILQTVNQINPLKAPRSDCLNAIVYKMIAYN